MLITKALYPPDAIEEIEHLITEAHAIYSTDPGAAIRIADEAISLAESCGDRILAARALRARAMAHGSKGAIGEAFADFLVALDRSRTLGFRLLESQCLHGLALCYFYQGEYSLSLSYMYRSVGVQREIGDDKGLMFGLNNLGTCNGELGNFEEGVSNLTESLGIARRLKNRNAEAMALGNIGLYKLACDDAEGAVEDLLHSLKIGEETGERVTLASTFASLSDAYRQLGRSDESVYAARRSLEIGRAVSNPYLEVVALRNLGLALEQQKQYVEAQEVLESAREVAVGRQTDSKYASIAHDLGSFYVRRGDFERARLLLEDGLTRATAAEQKPDMRDIHRTLSDLYAALRDHERALAEFKIFYDLDQGLEKQAARNRMMAQSAQLDVERAKQRAEIHRLRNVELVEVNREKTALLDRLQGQTNRLVREATEDALTGLYNRRYLNDFLTGESGRSAAHRSPVAVVIADLDNFKRVNDQFSHRTGDEVLRICARLFEQDVRRQDVVARYGGEEFVVVLPDATRSEAAAICERIRASVESHPWEDICPDLAVTVSMGIACGLTGDAEDLLYLADQRLYEAKRSGKNRVL